MKLLQKFPINSPFLVVVVALVVVGKGVDLWWSW